MLNVQHGRATFTKHSPHNILPVCSHYAIILFYIAFKLKLHKIMIHTRTLISDRNWMKFDPV
jgi:hypothetical protein